MNTATFSKRLMAYNIDITVLMFLVLPVSFLIESNLLMYIVAFVIVSLYHAIMESTDWQATLGKKNGRMKVTDLDGKRISFGRGLLRILAKFLSLVLFFGGFIMIYFRRDRRGLHDLIAGTKVVMEESTESVN